MATKKISELEAINAAEDNDVLVIVDTSESTTNKITKGNLLIGAGHTIEMTLNENYQIVLVLKNAAGTALSTQTIDLPNENAVTNLAYNNGILTITKQSGATSQINLTGLIEGLVTESDFNTFVTAIKGIIGISTNTYDSTQTYNTGDIVVQSEKIYKANQDNITGTFDSSKWDEISLYEYQKIQDEAIAENYKVINKLNEKLENQQKVIDQLPQVEGQGTSITLENTIEAQFTIFDVEGNSTQETTEGYQLVSFTNLKTQSQNGVTITNNNDGSITLNGTSTAAVSLQLSDIMSNLVAGIYQYSANASGTKSGNFSIIVYARDKSQSPDIIKSDAADTFSMTSNKNYEMFYLWLYITEGRTFNNYTIKPMFNSGETAQPWEKFTYGASPNPNYEQPILSSGDNGSINEKISNKNLFVIKNYSKSGWIVTIDNPLKGMPAGDYTISCQNKSSAGGIRTYFSNEPSGAVIGNLFTDFQFGDTLMVRKETLTQEQLNAKYLILYFNSANGSQSVLEDMQIMIEQGSTATSYVEHKEQDYSIFVQQPMRSIGDVRDLFFKNVKGSKYYNEDLEENKWYERHYIGEYIANNDLPGNGMTDTLIGLLTPILNIAPGLTGINFTSIVRSNLLQNTIINNSGLGGTNGDSRIRVNLSKDFAKTFDEANAFLTNNKFKIEFVQKEPLDLPCTEEQIDVLENKPSTYKDFTIINSEDETPAYLEVSGIRDINTMFDKVTNAIISLGGNV